MKRNRRNAAEKWVWNSGAGHSLRASRRWVTSSRSVMREAGGRAMTEYAIICTVRQGGAIRTRTGRHTICSACRIGARTRWPIRRSLWRLSATCTQIGLDLAREQHLHIVPAARAAVILGRVLGRGRTSMLALQLQSLGIQSNQGKDAPANALANPRP